MLKLIAAPFLCLFMLSACVQTPPTPTYPDITFNHLNKIPLDIAAITSTLSHADRFDGGHIEALTPISLGAMAANWANQRVEAAGESGIFTFDVRRASIIQTDLETQKGVVGFFTVEQGTHYQADLEIIMEAIDENSGRKAVANSTITQSLTVAENLSLTERNKEIYSLIEATLTAMDQQLSNDISLYFQRFNPQ